LEKKEIINLPMTKGSMDSNLMHNNTVEILDMLNPNPSAYDSLKNGMVFPLEEEK
jgi:hypothetical protein